MYGMTRKKQRFEKVVLKAADEGRDDYDVIEKVYADKNGISEKFVSIDPFDLPDELVLHIFRTDTSLLLAERVSAKWRSKIRCRPEFWKNACTRLSLNEKTRIETET